MTKGTVDQSNGAARGAYPAWGKDDGGWNEGPGYRGAHMSFALHFVVVLREASGTDLSQRPFFRNTFYYRFHITRSHYRVCMLPALDGRWSKWWTRAP